MRFSIIVMLSITLGGCWVNAREPIVYTQSEIDAINARAECKRLARTLVQVSRCDTR